MSTDALLTAKESVAHLVRTTQTSNWASERESAGKTYEVPDKSKSAPKPVLEGNETTTPLPKSVPVASQLLAEWHGQVTEVMDAAFSAQLKGRHGVGVAGNEDEALIPIEDVRESDLELLVPGAFFRLCISYEIDQHGSKRRYTEVVFRRLPAYRREELQQAQERARAIVRGLRLE